MITVFPELRREVTEIPVPCLSWVSSPGRLWADRKWRSLPFPQGQHYLSLPLDITGLPAHPLLTPLLQTCCWERIMSVPWGFQAADLSIEGGGGWKEQRWTPSPHALSELPMCRESWPLLGLAWACSQAEHRQVGICESEALPGRRVEGKWQKMSGFRAWSGGEEGLGVPGQRMTKQYG